MVLHRRRVGGAGRDYDRVLHGAMLTERLHDARDLARPLPDGAVDADDVGAPLVDDRVDCDRGLTGPSVADDQLPLPAPDRNHGVDRLDPRLEGLLHRLTRHDPGSDDVDLPGALDGIDRAAAIQGCAQRIHDPTEVALAYAHLEHASGPAHRVPLMEAGPVPHDDGSDVVLFEVQRQSGDGLSGPGRRDLQHLAGHGLHETVYASDSVLDLENLPYFLGVELLLVVLDLRKEDTLDLAGAQLGVVCHDGDVSRFWFSRSAPALGALPRGGAA